MIRRSLSASAAHAFAHVTLGAGVRLVRRVTDGGSSTVKSATNLSAPVWLRATQKAAENHHVVVLEWHDVDGHRDRQHLMGTSAYVGIAVNGRSTTSRATAVISNVTLTGSQRVHRTPCPVRASKTDLGPPAIAGTTQYQLGELHHPGGRRRHLGHRRPSSISSTGR